MKIIFLITLFAFITVGCDRTEDPPDCNIIEGSYMGQFHYQGINYGYLIKLDSNNYREGLSGGLYRQKYCYTAGTYLVESNKLVFELDSCLNNMDSTNYPCNQENWLLPGEYTIDYCSDDSLVFERGEGDGLIIYYIKRDTY